MKTGMKLMIGATIVIILLALLLSGALGAIIGIPGLLFKSGILMGIISGAKMVTKIIIWVVTIIVIGLSWLIYLLMSKSSESSKESTRIEEYDRYFKNSDGTISNGTVLKRDQSKYYGSNYSKFNKPSFEPKQTGPIIDAEFTEVKEESVVNDEIKEINSNLFDKADTEEKPFISDSEVEDFNREVDELTNRLRTDYDLDNPFKNINNKNTDSYGEQESHSPEEIASEESSVLSDNRIEVENSSVLRDDRISFTGSIYDN